MTGRYLIPLCKKRLFRFCSHLPLLTACVPYFYLCTHLASKRHAKTPLPSFLSGVQNQNDDRRKNIIWLLAKNPALVNRNRVVNSCTFCLDSSLYPVLIYSCIPDRLLRPFKNDRQVFSTVEKQNPPLPNSHHSRWSGMAFYSLLQRRFAPRKAVRLPSLRSRMTGRYLVPFCK